MRVRLRRPVFAEVAITEIANAHTHTDETGATETTTTTRPRAGSVAVPLDHDHLPILTAEQVLQPRELRAGGETAIVSPPDWIVTSAEGESLPCPNEQFERLFEIVQA